MAEKRERREPSRNSSGMVNKITNDDVISEVGKSLVVKKEKTETRSKRMFILVKPSTYAKMLVKCEQVGGISINEAFNQLSETWVSDIELTPEEVEKILAKKKRK